MADVGNIASTLADDPLTISTQQPDGNQRTSNPHGHQSQQQQHHHHHHHQQQIYQQLERTLAHVRQYLPADWKPTVAIICGSGLGGLVETLRPPTDTHQSAISIDYADIPHFPQSTGNCHNTLYCSLNNVNVKFKGMSVN
jgi:hypothetical protein